MIVALHLVRMVQSVWINMVATHVSALISGLVTTVQVYYILILAGYTCNSIGYTGMCEILMLNSSLSLLNFLVVESDFQGCLWGHQWYICVFIISGTFVFLLIGISHYTFHISPEYTKTVLPQFMCHV